MPSQYIAKSSCLLVAATICTAAFSQPFSLPGWAEQYFSASEIQAIANTAEKFGRPNYITRTATQSITADFFEYQIEAKCTVTSGGYEYCVSYSGWGKGDQEPPALYAAESLTIGGLIGVLVILQQPDGKTTVNKLMSHSAEMVGKDLQSYSEKHLTYEFTNQCEKKGVIDSTTVGKLRAVQLECVDIKNNPQSAGRKNPIYYLPDKNIYLPGSFLEPELHPTVPNSKGQVQLTFK